MLNKLLQACSFSGRNAFNVSNEVSKRNKTGVFEKKISGNNTLDISMNAFLFFGGTVPIVKLYDGSHFKFIDLFLRGKLFFYDDMTTEDVYRLCRFIHENKFNPDDLHVKKYINLIRFDLLGILRRELINDIKIISLLLFGDSFIEQWKKTSISIPLEIDKEKYLVSFDNYDDFILEGTYHSINEKSLRCMIEKRRDILFEYPSVMKNDYTKSRRYLKYLVNQNGQIWNPKKKYYIDTMPGIMSMALNGNYLTMHSDLNESDIHELLVESCKYIQDA